MPIVLLGYSLDIFISGELKKSNSHAQKEYPIWNTIIEGKLNSDILIYGSSRACGHFDTKIIEDSLKQLTFNIGIEGHRFKLQYLRHLLAFKNNPKPKLIIHSVEGTTLERGNLYNPDQFLPYMLFNDIFFDFTSEFKGYSSLDYKIPLIRYYGKLDALKTALKMIIMPQSNLVERVKGYQGHVRSWNNDFDNAKKTMKKYAMKIDSSTLVLFDKYLKECKEQEIEVILVYSPIYIEGQEFMANNEDIINVYKKYAMKYDFSFLDFTNDELCYKKEYFYNTTHLNKTGAELFTKKLTHEIKNRR
jgi:hypothetical protein